MGSGVDRGDSPQKCELTRYYGTVGTVPDVNILAGKFVPVCFVFSHCPGGPGIPWQYFLNIFARSAQENTAGIPEGGKLYIFDPDNLGLIRLSDRTFSRSIRVVVFHGYLCYYTNNLSGKCFFPARGFLRILALTRKFY